MQISMGRFGYFDSSAMKLESVSLLLALAERQMSNIRIDGLHASMTRLILIFAAWLNWCKIVRIFIACPLNFVYNIIYKFHIKELIA